MHIQGLLLSMENLVLRMQEKLGFGDIRSFIVRLYLQEIVIVLIQDLRWNIKNLLLNIKKILGDDRIFSEVKCAGCANYAYYQIGLCNKIFMVYKCYISFFFFFPQMALNYCLDMHRGM